MLLVGVPILVLSRNSFASDHACYSSSTAAINNADAKALSLAILPLLIDSRLNQQTSFLLSLSINASIKTCTFGWW